MHNEHAPMVNLSEVEQDSETFGELGDYGYPSQSILIKLSIKQAAFKALLTEFLYCGIFTATTRIDSRQIFSGGNTQSFLR